MKQKLQLAEVVAALRDELARAEQLGRGQDIGFTVGDIDIELETAIEFTGGGEISGTIKFWVLEFDAKLSGEYAQGVTHKIKLKLGPHQRTPRGNAPIDLAGEDV